MKKTKSKKTPSKKNEIELVKNTSKIWPPPKEAGLYPELWESINAMKIGDRYDFLKTKKDIVLKIIKTIQANSKKVFQDGEVNNEWYAIKLMRDGRTGKRYAKR